MNGLKRRWIWLLLIGATVCFIFGNSLLPASLSDQFSNGVRKGLNQLFSLGGSDGVQMTRDGVLRKLAHMTEFAALGLELFVWQCSFLPRRWPLLALSGLVTALLDETIQLFVTGRAGRVADVWIDFGGLLLGGLVGVLLSELSPFSKKKNKINK